MSIGKLEKMKCSSLVSTHESTEGLAAQPLGQCGPKDSASPYNLHLVKEFRIQGSHRTVQPGPELVGFSPLVSIKLASVGPLP